MDKKQQDTAAADRQIERNGQETAGEGLHLTDK
jgi:hypothetical protein